MKRRSTLEIKAKITALKADGLSFRQIAKAVPCSRGSVSYHLSTSTHEKKKERNRGIPNKIKIELGGKCRLCGYDKYLGALDFHHLDPSQKLFGIGSRNPSSNKTEQQIREEVSKCALVCSNCHKEIHAGVTQLTIENCRSDHLPH